MTARKLLGGLLALAAATTLAAWVVLPFESYTRTTAINLAQLTAALAGGVALLVCARDPRRSRCGRAFIALGTGCLSWGAGQAVWSYYEVVQRQPTPFPSAADIGFLAAVPFLAAGLALWPKNVRRWRGGDVVDAALVAGVGTLFSIEFVLEPIIAELDGITWAGLLLLAYPVADLVLFTCAAGGLLLHGWAERGRLLVVSASFLALVFADTYFALAGEQYATGELADLGWVACFVLAGASAILPPGWAGGRARRGQGTAVAVSLAGLLLLFALHQFADQWAQHDAIEGFGILGMGLALALLVARTSHMARVRAREAGQLASAQAELAQAYAVRNGALEASRTGVCVFGADGDARFANSVFERLLGPVGSWAGFVAQISRLSGGDRAEPGQSVQGWSADGRLLSVAFTALPTGELLASVDDLTDQQRERELRGRLIAETVSAQEREARRIGELLHDDAVQQLTALSLRLELEAQRSARPELSALAADCGSIISSLRRLLVELHPAVLESQGLAAAVDASAETLRSHGVAVTVPPFTRRFSAELERLVYKLLQEALSNVLKHADASEAEVSISVGGRLLRCRVSDDGRGFAPERLETAVKDGHLGLHIVRERVELAGGRMLVESRPGHGTSFSFELPLAPEATLALVENGSA